MFQYWSNDLDELGVPPWLRTPPTFIVCQPCQRDDWLRWPSFFLGLFSFITCQKGLGSCFKHPLHVTFMTYMSDLFLSPEDWKNIYDCFKAGFCSLFHVLAISPMKCSIRSPWLNPQVLLVKYPQLYPIIYIPICSMYGIFTNICPKNHPNVG